MAEIDGCLCSNTIKNSQFVFCEIMRTERNSNIELLRIILMIFILFHHFLVWGAFPCMLDSSKPLYPEAVSAIYINGFLYMAVNCFILVSGYFGIKFSFKKLLSFYLICVFYAFVCQIVGIISFDNEYTIKSIIYNSVFCISKTWLWYVKCYFALLCLTPILNPARETLTKKRYTIAILLMAFVSFYFGFWRKSLFFDLDGYSVYQFIFLYFVGGYVKKYFSGDFIKKYRIGWLFFYVIFSFLWGFLSVLNRTGYDLKHWYPFNYNNPILVFSAVSFLLLSLSVEFKNRFVNFLASGAFAVYLATENDYIRNGLYSYVTNVSFSNIGILFSIAVVLAIVIMCFDKIRDFITMPILSLYDRYIGTHVDKNF